MDVRAVPGTILGLTMTLVGALQAATDLLQRADGIERSLARGGRQVTDTLDEIRERLRSVAASLQAELKRDREVLAPMSRQIAELQEAAAHLEGSIEHVLDRVPGLSAKNAAERGRSVSPGLVRYGAISSRRATAAAIVVASGPAG